METGHESCESPGLDLAAEQGDGVSSYKNLVIALFPKGISQHVNGDIHIRAFFFGLGEHTVTRCRRMAPSVFAQHPFLLEGSENDADERPRFECLNEC